MSIYYGPIIALETASACGMVCAFDQGRIYGEFALAQKMSHGRLICDALGSAEQSLNNDKRMLTGMMVGLGPGSFVGLRIALATALGFCFGRDIVLMGFSSHFALAASFETETKDKAVVMKASGDWCYVTRFEQSLDGSMQACEPARELKRDDVLHVLKPQTAVLGDVTFTAQELAFYGMQAHLVLGPTALGIKKAVDYRLAQCAFVDESDTIKLNYVRAPSVSMPKMSPIVGQLITDCA